jgi:hypothetical protein
MTNPTIWETDVCLGTQQAPNGHCVYRYSNDCDYSGYMRNGKPDGYGVMRGPRYCYAGNWQEGLLVDGVMFDTLLALQYHIGPPAISNPATEGFRGPQ